MTTLSRYYQPNSPLLVAGAILVAAVGISVVAQSLGAGPVFYIFYTFAILIFSLTHSALLYGWRLAFAFLVLVLVISWSYETLSIITGFPFGHYHYTDRFVGPSIGLVPLMIMPAYYAMGYLSWAIAAILLDKRDGGTSGFDVILMPVLASFVMVAWDMSMDPANSTIAGAWEWHDGGAYFGVPFQNYFGWFLCVFTFYFVFSLLLARRNPVRCRQIDTRLYWLLVPVMYLTRTFQYFLSPLTRPNVEVSSGDGRIWWTGDIYQSLLLVAIFTMIFMAGYALVRVFRSPDLI